VTWATGSAPPSTSSAPMARALLMNLAIETNVLLIVSHHAIGDQWSGGVPGAIWHWPTGRTRGQAPQWAPLRINTPTTACGSVNNKATKALESELAYWRTRLHGTPPLALPRDVQHGLVGSSRSRSKART